MPSGVLSDSPGGRGVYGPLLTPASPLVGSICRVKAVAVPELCVIAQLSVPVSKTTTRGVIGMGDGLDLGEPQIGDQQPSDSGQAAGTPAPLLGRRNAAR